MKRMGIVEYAEAVEENGEEILGRVFTEDCKVDIDRRTTIFNEVSREFTCDDGKVGSKSISFAIIY